MKNFLTVLAMLFLGLSASPVLAQKKPKAVIAGADTITAQNYKISPTWEGFKDGEVTFRFFAVGKDTVRTGGGFSTAGAGNLELFVSDFDLFLDRGEWTFVFVVENKTAKQLAVAVKNVFVRSIKKR